MSTLPKYPGERITANGNQLVSYHTEARIADAGIFYPITPSTEGGELYQQSFAQGRLNVFGRNTIAIEAEGEHAAQGGAIAYSVCGRRVVNFTSGQGIVYGIEQYYHAPGKASTMVVEVVARALTKHALNVHCGHDDVYGALDVGWTILFAKDAQQAADQALILRRVNELSLTPGMNVQDGFLTSHLERTFYRHESELLRKFLGAPEDIIECPTESQRVLFGPTRRRVPRMIDLTNPVLLGPVQNQEHYMQGVVARRDNFVEPILDFLEEAYEEFGRLTGRYYGLVTEYKTEDADTVFVSLGSAAENCEAAVDYLRETRGSKVGSIHLNVFRPFPERAVVEALAGKRNAIILERTDEPMAGDNPMGRDTRTALNKALKLDGHPVTRGFPALTPDRIPRLFNGIYGLGSRDFRPEQIIGAYEFVTGQRARTDGKTAADGESFMVLGVPHPYEVMADETPSLLPDGAIAVRFHSIGGWGAITTGKNLGAIIGDFNDFLSERSLDVDEYGRPKEVIHVSANPKYGSEKKGAPTSYFLVIAPERIRVNCDLRHVDAVLCCDPKAFTHCNPLEGMSKGGAFIWESEESPQDAWERLPVWARTQIIQNQIRMFTLPGFDIARNATNRPDLQLRMQGNAFLGAFFSVSTLLQDFEISREQFEGVVLNQYNKKFGRYGNAVVESNMQVMTQGFSRVREIPVGELDAADRSTLRGVPLLPVMAPANGNGNGATPGCATCRSHAIPEMQDERTPLTQVSSFDDLFRSDYGYDQPASPLAAMSVMAAGSGDTASKYVARRETPLFIAENCTQCMECISVCPDTALPNCSQDIDTILRTAIANYVSDDQQRGLMLAAVPEMERRTREAMKEAVAVKAKTPLPAIIRDVTNNVNGFSETAKAEFFDVIDKQPLAYSMTTAIFRSAERKNPGSGGIFSIFVSDLCKGCAACVTACGDHDALRMVQETEEVNADHETGTAFLDLLPDTSQKFLGLYNNENPADSKTATLRNLMMVRRNYDALVSGDGACAGCGEKSVLRAIAGVTEAYLRPIFHTKADRLRRKADLLEAEGPQRLEWLQARDPNQHKLLVRTVAHLLMNLGGDTDEDTTKRLEAHGPISNEDLVGAITAVMRQEAFNHQHLQALDGRLANGQSVMAMAAHTGCNTVYGSTPPNNPHPYPWMNSLFQDGATIGWLIGESFMVDHGRRSVIPERLATSILERDDVIDQQTYYNFTHFSDNLMTAKEINEMPKVWVIGGDGGMGDIGYQNVSKMILQNRPNVKALMLDTQVYSNTGGQNSDSTPMLGGGDMNSFGAASQGKCVEKKTVAETFLAGHGSPFVAQVSIANAPKLFRAILDSLEYRGTAFLQCFTTCQPEHGVGDDMALDQAQRVRDSRGAPEFVFNPEKGETYPEALDLKGNPNPKGDWYKTRFKATGEMYRYTVAHWCATEARFRNHLKKASPEEAEMLIPLENMLVRITQNDVVQRHHLNPDHRAYVPDFGVYMKTLPAKGTKPLTMKLSRQMVLFCVERRKAWRLLQSKIGLKNAEYEAQRAILKDVDAGTIAKQDFCERADQILEERLLAAAPVVARGRRPRRPIRRRRPKRRTRPS